MAHIKSTELHSKTKPHNSINYIMYTDSQEECQMCIGAYIAEYL